jgi:hypothetical protein
MNSNLSLIKFSLSTTSGSSKIIPIFNLLTHAVENFLISVCTSLSDPCLELVYCCRQQGGCSHYPSQKPTNDCRMVSTCSALTDSMPVLLPLHTAIGNKTLVPSTNRLLTWGTVLTLLLKPSLHCNNRFCFMKQ